MTIKECIDIIDSNKPNQYTITDKVRWLSFIEEIIINDVLKTHEGYDGRYDDFTGYSDDKISVALIVPSPYDRLYTAYLKMKIDEENGETARYNNSAAMFNAYLSEYKKYYNKTHMPLSNDRIGEIVKNKANQTKGLTDAEMENLKNELTYNLTEYFSNTISDDKVYDVVTKYMQTNVQLLKGEDGKTPIKGQDYFTEADIKAITDELNKYAKGEIQNMSRDFVNAVNEVNTKYNNLSATVENELPNKVDKIDGKGLSTEDYTSEEKYLLASVSSKVTNIESEIAYKVDAEPGKGLSTEDYTTEDKRLLYEHEEEINGIAANASDIAKLSGRVDTNAGDIATNATAIEANAKGIVDFGTRVTEAENDIAAVDERLTQTEANVQNNQNAIDANSDAIEANEKTIAQNLQSIADIEDRAIVCTASGENIHLSDSSNSKLKGMRVFGKTIQDMFCNNQGTRTITTNGCTYTLVDGKTEMVVTGTSTTAFSIPLSKLTLAAGTYSISFSGATYGSVYMYISNASNGQTILGGIYSTNTLTITETTDVMINMVILAEKIFDNAVIKVSLTGNLSPETPHSFISVGDSGSISVNVKNEPDFDNQMLSISTPTALFGVPVAKDGNYIDSAGKQWICDEIDLNRGVHIKRLALSTVAFSHFGTHSDGRVYGVMYAPLKIEKSDAGALCEKAEFVSAKTTANCFYENAKNIVFSGDESDTNETLKAKFEGCRIIYILADAVETPLTAEQIEAYKTLHTYKTTTNIYNNDNAYMQVEYIADTKSYVGNKRVEQTYDPTSENAQSGIAVAQSIKSCLKLGNNLYSISDETKGYISVNGDISPITNELILEKTSDYIPVTEGSKYAFQIWVKVPEGQQLWMAYYCYDSDKNPIGSRVASSWVPSVEDGISYSYLTFDAPPSTAYIRVSGRSFGNAKFKLEQGNPTEYVIKPEDVINNYEVSDNDYINYDAIVKSINHRGYCTVAPENTLSAYKLSKEMGFKYVECDVEFTSDGVPVLLHDTTIDRTSNGTGNIADMTLEQVREYDFGSWKSEKYAGEKIPTFEEFIILCKNIGLYPYIELKGEVDEQRCQTLIDIVHSNGMKEKSTWISFNTISLTNIKNIDAAARLGYLIMVSISESPYIIPNALSLKTDTNEVFLDWYNIKLTDDAINLCIQNSIPLEVWTVATHAEVLSHNPYITGMTSDYIIAGKVLYESGNVTSASHKYVNAVASGVKKYTDEKIAQIPTGGGGKKLIMEYIHTSNPVYQPTVFDKETGIFTCVGHGISTSKKCVMVMNNNLAYDAAKLPKSVGGYWWSAELVRVDDDTFKINDWDITTATNLDTIDVTSFHFEVPNTFTIKDIPVCDNIHIEMLGKGYITSWWQITPSMCATGTLVTYNTGTYASFGRPGYGTTDMSGIFYLTGDIHNGETEVFATRETVRCDSTGNKKEFQKFVAKYPPYTNETFNISHSYSGMDYQGVLNGFAIRVYKISEV